MNLIFLGGLRKVTNFSKNQLQLIRLIVQYIEKKTKNNGLAGRVCLDLFYVILKTTT